MTAGEAAGGGIGALRRYLTATGLREAPSVSGDATGSDRKGTRMRCLIVRRGWRIHSSRVATSRGARRSGVGSGENDAKLTFDDAAEALDWLCRALTVPHALRAAAAVAVAAGLVTRLSKRVGMTRAAAERLGDELSVSRRF